MVRIEAGPGRDDVGFRSYTSAGQVFESWVEGIGTIRNRCV